jgi:hypothetical protein
VAQRRTMDDGQQIPVTTQMGPFGIVPAWVLSYELSGSEFKVYISIRSYANADRECWPTTKAIAERACVARGTARNAIQRFRRLGLISTENRYRADGSFGGHLYVLADINPALIDPSMVELDAHRKAKAKAGTSNDAPAANGTKTGQNDAEAGTSFSAPPCPDPCTPGTPNDAPIEQTIELTFEETKPPAQAASTPASPPPAEPRSKAGEGNPSKPKPTDLLGATIDQVATLKAGNQRWTREKIADVVAEALSQGRTEQLIIKAIVDLAHGVHGDTDSPRRLLAGGPWWDVFIPAPAVDRSTMCRQHRGEPATTCGRCAAERKGAEPEGGLLPGRTRKEFTRRSGTPAGPATRPAKGGGIFSGEPSPGRRPTPTGIGICVTCGNAGKHTPAVDDKTGSHCAMHLRAMAAV